MEGDWNSVNIILSTPLDFDGDGSEDNDTKVELPCLNHSFTLNSDGSGKYTSNQAGLSAQPAPTLYGCFPESTSMIEWTELNGTVSIIGKDLNFQMSILENNSLLRIVPFESLVYGSNDTDEGRISFERQ